MSRTPLLSSPTLASLTSSCADSWRLSGTMPATKALNDSLLDSYEERVKAVRREKCSTATTSHFGEKASTLRKDHAFAFDTEGFPDIEWNCMFTDSSDLEDEMEQETPKLLLREQPRRRGSLVRSIALVSNILSELQTKQKQTSPPKQASKAVLARPTSPFRKRRITKHTRKHSLGPPTGIRLVDLSQPTPFNGLQADRLIASTEQYFL